MGNGQKISYGSHYNALSDTLQNVGEIQDRELRADLRAAPELTPELIERVLVYNGLNFSQAADTLNWLTNTNRGRQYDALVRKFAERQARRSIETSAARFAPQPPAAALESVTPGPAPAIPPTDATRGPAIERVLRAAQFDPEIPQTLADLIRRVYGDHTAQYREVAPLIETVLGHGNTPLQDLDAICAAAEKKFAYMYETRAGEYRDWVHAQISDPTDIILELSFYLTLYRYGFDVILNDPAAVATIRTQTTATVDLFRAFLPTEAVTHPALPEQTRSEAPQLTMIEDSPRIRALRDHEARVLALLPPINGDYGGQMATWLETNFTGTDLAATAVETAAYLRERESIDVLTDLGLIRLFAEKKHGLPSDSFRVWITEKLVISNDDLLAIVLALTLAAAPDIPAKSNSNELDDIDARAFAHTQRLRVHLQPEIYDRDAKADDLMVTEAKKRAAIAHIRAQKDALPFAQLSRSEQAQRLLDFGSFNDLFETLAFFLDDSRFWPQLEPQLQLAIGGFDLVGDTRDLLKLAGKRTGRGMTLELWLKTELPAHADLIDQIAYAVALSIYNLETAFKRDDDGDLVENGWTEESQNAIREFAHPLAGMMHEYIATGAVVAREPFLPVVAAIEEASAAEKADILIPVHVLGFPKQVLTFPSPTHVGMNQYSVPLVVRLLVDNMSISPEPTPTPRKYTAPSHTEAMLIHLEEHRAPAAPKFHATSSFSSLGNTHAQHSRNAARRMPSEHLPAPSRVLRSFATRRR